jgi:hypothetical protein
VRDSKSQASVAKHTGRPERRLDSCAARDSTLASNPIAFSPTAHYRSQAGTPKAYGRIPGNRRGLPGRVTESGMLAWPVSGVDGEPGTTHAHLIHREPTGFPAAAVLSPEAPWVSDGLSGTRRVGAVRAVPSSSRDRRITGESTHAEAPNATYCVWRPLGLTPSVFTESCPSLGRSRTGGAVPPETNGHL